MKQNKNIILNFIIFIIIFFIVASVILTRPLSNLDEIWNYNFARNVADGLIPYKDFNMVTTPLLPFICSLFLNLFSNELFTMRILACFLISGIFFLVYQIFKKLKINTFFNFITLFSFFIILKDYICIDYNFAILFLLLLLIYLEINHVIKISNSKKNNQGINIQGINNLKINTKKISYSNKLYHFFIGILAGSCILLKQSTGVVIAFMTIFYPIFIIRNKIDFKNYLKNISFRILGIIVLIILFFIYLICTNSFYYFIDYAILGIKTFSNSIPYRSLLNSMNLVIKILSILMPIFIILSGIYCFIKKEKILYIFYFYSLASLVVILPIADNIHFLIGITPFFILFVYLFYQFFLWAKNKINNNSNIINLIKNKKIIIKIKLFIKYLIKCFVVLFFIYYFIKNILYLNNYLKNITPRSLEHYNYISIDDDLYNKIKLVNNYILSQNNEVYILDAEAAIYMISLDRYNKDFDMFNKGNLGAKGEKGMIEKIQKMASGTKLLIKNDRYNKNWQTPMEVINYIKNNLNKISEISIFDIYEI